MVLLFLQIASYVVNKSSLRLKRIICLISLISRTMTTYSLLLILTRRQNSLNALIRKLLRISWLEITPSYMELAIRVLILPTRVILRRLAIIIPSKELIRRARRMLLEKIPFRSLEARHFLMVILKLLIRMRRLLTWRILSYRTIRQLMSSSYAEMRGQIARRIRVAILCSLIRYLGPNRLLRVRKIVNRRVALLVSKSRRICRPLTRQELVSPTFTITLIILGRLTLLAYRFLVFRWVSRIIRPCKLLIIRIGMQA